MKPLADILGIKIIRQEGAENVCTCPFCEGNKLYIHQKTGAWQCFKGCGQGYPYQLIKKVTGKTPKEIFAMLESIGIKSEKTVRQTSVKDITWLTEQLREPTESEMSRLVTAKKITPESLRTLKPMTLGDKSILCLPCHTPGTQIAAGYIRVHMDGELITLADGRQEKYPAVGNMGLLGMEWLQSTPYQNILFCEGWRDRCAAVALGFAATASSGGASTWKDDWLPIFEDKDVAVIMDEDAAGVGGYLTIDGKQVMKRGAAVRAATAIKKVARTVKIVRLPFAWKETHGKDLYDYIMEAQ